MGRDDTRSGEVEMEVIKLIHGIWARRLAVDVSARQIARLLGVALVTAWVALLCGRVPVAFAQPCVDVEVVFARGTGEPPGVGGVGEAFVDSLRSQVGARSVEVYAVNYPARGDFLSADFPGTVIDGMADEIAHVESLAANCPNTRMVLGGYSQGAALTGFVTEPAALAGVPDLPPVPAPLPPQAANHVAAIALFGKPSDQYLQSLGEPPLVIGSVYVPKTIDLCAPGDEICGEGGSDDAHHSYPVNGMVDQAAGFAASRL
jgi:cutinase